MPARGVVLVTGCSTGIGRAAAIAFHRRGWEVVATARRLEDIADLAAQGMTTLTLDVLSEESMRAAVLASSPADTADVIVKSAEAARPRARYLVGPVAEPW